MGRGNSFRLTVVALALAVTVGSVPAAAAPSAQFGKLLTFEKPEWGLKMLYPEGYHVKDETEFVAFTQQTESMVFPSSQYIIVARDPAFADPNGTLNDALALVLQKAGRPIDASQAESLGARTVADEEGRAASFSGTEISSGYAMSGNLYVIAKGDTGFAFLTAGSVNLWSVTELGVFQPVVKSVEIAVAEPTATPVATPKPAKPTAPKPESDAEGAPEPTATTEPVTSPDETGIYSTAREAFDTAALLAAEWSPGAGLSSIGCPALRVEGGDAGKCRRWTLMFAGGTKPGGMLYRVTLADGELTESGETPPAGTVAPVAGAWIDSPEALQTALDGGLSGFLKRHPGAPTMAILDAGLWTTWAATLLGDRFEVRADAVSAAVDVLPPTPPATVGKLLSARQVLPLAQKKAKEWQADARLVELGAELGLAGAGAEAGKALEWQAVFTSTAAGKARSFSIRGGQAQPPADAATLARTPVSGMWPDSPKVLQGLAANEDYASFSELYPEHALALKLQGQAGSGFVWKTTAHVQGARLTVALGSAAATPTPSPMPADADPAAQGEPTPAADEPAAAEKAVESTVAKRTEVFRVSFLAPPGWLGVNTDDEHYTLMSKEALKEGNDTSALIIVGDVVRYPETELKAALIQEIQHAAGLPPMYDTTSMKAFTFQGCKAVELKAQVAMTFLEGVSFWARAIDRPPRVTVLIAVSPGEEWLSNLAGFSAFFESLKVES
jgi:hypothetical protein